MQTLLGPRKGVLISGATFTRVRWYVHCTCVYVCMYVCVYVYVCMYTLSIALAIQVKFTIEPPNTDTFEA